MDPNLKSTLMAAAILEAQPPVRPSPTAPYRMRYLGDPVLREVCKSATPENFKVQHPLFRAMEAIINEGAYGISAPQLGVPLQVAMIRTQFTPSGCDYKLLIIINPREIKLDLDSRRLAYEGCLSIPGFEIQVMRSMGMDFTYRDSQFLDHRITLDGVAARVAQHEIDHLRGKLITDYATRQQRRSAERKVADFLAKQRHA